MIGDSTILVTGGAGFIGSHLVERLVSDGACVTVVDNLSTGSLENLRTVLPNIRLITAELGDVLRTNQVELGDYQIVFHLAANAYIPPSVENPAFDYRVNLDNTFHLLEALRQTKNSPRLVNTSTAGVYGNPFRLPIRETDPTVPISPYGVSKLAGERYAAVYSQIYGLHTTSLRLFSVYGPRQRKQVVYDLLCKLRADPQRLQVIGDGSQARDFAYVLDVVQAMILAATTAPGRGEVYNVASGTSHTIAELVDTWCRVCHLSPQVVYSGQVRPGDAQKWIGDISQLKQLGYGARMSLEAGLAAVAKWYDATQA
ncbi:MAG TPA: GDP-mannose 4,6-dehydratase [Anaerolineae bacterium]|nr:GDP-mannose 4,6-dehydratase [Anaerolineae bacterium]HOQ99511.1 GDP-mannose 4,6-dehydratase [Anaerolineae bacterium]